jgi:hypothetical protein
VLDACRDNPLADELKRTIGPSRALALQRGLAKIDSPQGMIVAYATQAGRTAEDGSGRNSPYTASFLDHIEEQEEIGTVFRRVSSDVYESTKHSQMPELSLSLIGEFYLRGKLEIAVTPPTPSVNSSPAAQPSPCTEAADHWKNTEAIGTKSAFEDHVARFPDCPFAGYLPHQVRWLTGNWHPKRPELLQCHFHKALTPLPRHVSKVPETEVEGSIRSKGRTPSPFIVAKAVWNRA